MFWFRQIQTVTANTVKIVIGDPFFTIIHLTALWMLALLASLPGFTQGENIRLLRDQAQALQYIVGCLCVTFGLIRALTDDIRRGAFAIVASRPIGAFPLMAGKWLGVLICVAGLHLSVLIASIWTSEVMPGTEYTNLKSLIFYLVVIVVGLSIGAVRHYIFGGSYNFSTNLIIFVLLAIGFCIRLGFSRFASFDWPVAQSSLVLFFGIVAFSSLLLPLALVADSSVVFSAGIGLFFFGLISDYLISTAINPGIGQRLLKSIVPNWQIYWVADRLGEGKHIPFGYLSASAFHALCFALLFFMISILIYDRLEVKNEAAV